MELFTIILSVAVFILLTSTLSILVYKLYRATIINIENGSFDAQIIKEEQETKKIKKNIGHLILVSIQIVLIIIIGYSLVTQNHPVRYFARPSIVLSGSMSEKNKKNTYLYENNLNNQIAVSDMIFIEKLPEKLNKYDIIVYRKDNHLIVHRLIEVKQDENGEKHYILRGDANNKSDDPINREQMIGVYRGHKIPYLGFFVRFLQSIPGLLCILLIFIINIITPMINKKFYDVKKVRADLIK